MASQAARRAPDASSPGPRQHIRTGTMSPSPSHAKPAPPARTSSAQRSSQNGNTSRTASRRASPNGQTAEKRLLDSEDEDMYSRASREQLITSLKSIKQEKEELSATLSKTTARVETLQQQNSDLAGSLEEARNISQQHFDDQQRVDTDLADLQQQCEQLQTQLKDAEKSKRDLEKRNKEEVSHFEAERATWQDAERNLKSRITQLANKSSSVEPQSKSRPVTPLPEESEVAPEPTPTKPESKSALIKPAESAAPAPINPNPELVAELAQLTADFEALQSQHAQLADKHSEEISQLHAANHKLQDEAESFQLLLGERTLSGEILGQGVFGQSWDAPASFRSAINSRNSTDFARQKSPRLEGVIEEDEVLEGHGDGDQHSGAMGVNGVERRKNKGGGRPKAPTAGLDLAAELDRAAEHEQTSQDVDRDPSNDPYAEWPEERLVAEIKALKDANKALTLYINRIVERVIASEGFEAVLASDFGSSVQAQSGSNSNQAPPLAPKDQLPPLNTSQQNTVPFSQMSPSTATPTTTDAIKEKRASSRLSFSALASSIFSSGPKSPPAEAPKLKPIYLANASGPRGVSNSTLDATEEEEYEEESRERDRINAELVQMGVTEEAGSPGLRQAQRNSIHQALDSSANSLSSSPGRAMTPEEQRQNSSSYFSPFASSAPAPPPQAKTAPVAAIDQISSINERDRQGVAELKNGRASGFSEPRRVSSTRARRERSRSSSQYSANVGEPYPSHASHNAPRASEDLSRSISNASGGDIVGDQGAGWGAKLLRRVSLSAR